jgi:hypothetical protein
MNLHLQGLRIRQVRNQHKAVGKLSKFCSMLGLSFGPEDGSDMFLRNVGISPIVTAVRNINITIIIKFIQYI